MMAKNLLSGYVSRAKSVRVVEVLVENGQARVLFEERAETYLEIGHNLEAPTEIIPIPATDELI